MEYKDNMMSDDVCCGYVLDRNSNASSLKKKRPERQLYIPPAQRVSNIFRTELSHRKNQTLVQNTKQEKFNSSLLDKCVLCPKDLYIMHNLYFRHYFWSYCKRRSDSFPVFFYRQHFFINCDKLPYQIQIFNRNSTKQNHLLCILDSNYFCWQPKINFYYSSIDVSSEQAETYPVVDLKLEHIQSNYISPRISLLVPIYCQRNYSQHFKEDLDFRITKIQWDYPYKHFQKEIIDLQRFGEGHCFMFGLLNQRYYFVNCMVNHDIMECYHHKKSKLLEKEQLSEIQMLQKEFESQVELTLKVKTLPLKESNLEVKNKNIKNVRHNQSDELNVSSQNCNQYLKKTNNHEEEKEILRKAKENMNRKSRPVIRYEFEDNMLSIDHPANVNSWEDLFDTKGELHDGIFTEIIPTVGSDLTNVKSSDDYSSCQVKNIQELEHMVELYDFPPSFETQDIIAAFSELNTDCMYVKWVDESHALLVLGSLTQAKRATELSNPLIKVRPMTAASRMAIAKANKFDLKPALKRPQTNLQTARRLITSHLGKKSTISKEQSAKETEDLRAAREQKKLTRKNEKDAWDGNLRSTINK